jgi:Uma2 family endonuclease
VKPATDRQQHYTYEDYYSWDDGKRWELIEGVPYAMAPAASDTHQRISSNLHGQLFSFLKGGPCKVFHAAYDVRLNADTGDDTVVQPDLVVICDQSKRDERGCKGAPDMVVEILSPSTASYDRVTKFNQYQKAGVREYWIVDPDSRTVAAHILENGRYIISAYGDEGVAPVHVLEGCEIDLADVFAE